MVAEDAVVVGIGETEKSRARADLGEPVMSVEQYFARAAKLTLDDAGIEKDTVDGLGVINAAVETPFTYPAKLAETLGFEVDYLFSEDLGGVNATSLLVQAAISVDAGIADTVLCLGADTPYAPGAESGDLFPRDPRGPTAQYTHPFGDQGPNASIALVQTAHQNAYGTTREQLGQIAVAQRHHASLNYLAYFDEKLDLETYLASDPVADPVHLHDCVIPVNAGYGFIVTNRNRAQSLDAPAVELAGYGARHNPEPVNQPDMTTTGVVDAAPTALDKAGIEPDDADFVQAYDDYPIIVAMQLEDIGFCAKGEGGEFVEQTGLRYDEKLPLNTSGGQLSAGQAGVAGGFDGLVEGIRQLQGAAGQRQIPDAARGIVTGVGGIAYGKNLLSSAVAVLERGEP